MQIQHFLKPAALALALASALAPVASAQAANFSFSGNITYQKDLVLIDFSVIAPSVVTLSTDSWQSGLNFDPLLTVFDSSQQLLIAADDNDGSLPGAGFYDSVIGPTPLQAGTYRLVLSASSNDAIGPALSNGFTYDGAAPIALADWNQPSYDINANDQKGGFWRVNLNGVEQAAVVPEPASVALMLAGLFGLIGLQQLDTRKRS